MNAVLSPSIELAGGVLRRGRAAPCWMMRFAGMPHAGPPDRRGLGSVLGCDNRACSTGITTGAPRLQSPLPGRQRNQPAWPGPGRRDAFPTALFLRPPLPASYRHSLPPLRGNGRPPSPPVDCGRRGRFSCAAGSGSTRRDSGRHGLLAATPTQRPAEKSPAGRSPHRTGPRI